MTPKEKARPQIDPMPAVSGWTVPTKDKINLSAGRGIAVCELSFATGEPAYQFAAFDTLQHWQLSRVALSQIERMSEHWR